MGTAADKYHTDSAEMKCEVIEAEEATEAACTVLWLEKFASTYTSFQSLIVLTLCNPDSREVFNQAMNLWKLPSRFASSLYGEKASVSSLISQG